MEQLKRPPFVELLYAVVIGSAFQFLNTSESLQILIAKILMVIIVLEDWFTYYNAVLSHSSPKSVVKSLALEFTILMTWYIAYVSIPKETITFLLSIGAFYLTKFAAGWSHYNLSRVFARDPATRDVFYVVPFAASWFLALLAHLSEISNSWSWYLSISVSFISLALWWMSWRTLPDE